LVELLVEYQSGYVKLALPKGRFLLSTANLLREVTLGFKDYNNKTRQYRLRSGRFPYLSAKIFQEKDIPVQVAIGNYDLGICGLDWVEELLMRYPASALVKISSLGYGEGSVYVVASKQAGMARLDELSAKQSDWRIVSEYPNLAQAFALNLRMKVFRIFPVWGAAEVYPPDSADLAILWARNENEIADKSLVPLVKLLPVSAFLIANRQSLENKDLSPILDCFSLRLIARRLSDKGWYREYFSLHKPQVEMQNKMNTHGKTVASHSQWQTKEIKLALPDGHQQPPTLQFLRRAGLNFEGYAEKALNRRPSTDLGWLGIKVIRPQDMPLQVANGNFDLAITGKDWLLEHLSRFPSSPVKELLDLGFGMVRIVAAISQNMPVNDINDLRAFIQSGKFAPLRVASEYISIADKYLRDNYINPYKLIPTWGASEAFLPEDADLLIDNAQTGKTLAHHHLKVIDVLFESTACLIGNKDSLNSRNKKDRIELLIQTLQKGYHDYPPLSLRANSPLH
jgi:ATP phosphoribosyltransferase